MNHNPWPRKKFAAKLRKIGVFSYHHLHPFHVLMNSGRLERQAIQIWVANRFYYQASIPIKDAAIISNCPLREVRRIWLHRITDHDGAREDEGGIGAWLRLGEACSLSRKVLLGHNHVVPGVRFAVDAYVHFARTQPWPVAVASSLTELFAPDLMAKRLAAFEKFYPWVDASGLDYFNRRLTQAPRDSGEALQLTLDHCNTLEMQQTALDALQFKCDLLWFHARRHSPSLLNALKSASTRCLRTVMIPMDEQSRPALARGVRLRDDPISGEPLLLYPEGVLPLDEITHDILLRCSGQSTLESIILSLTEEYEADHGTVRQDVRECLEGLRQRMLIALAP